MNSLQTVLALAFVAFVAAQCGTASTPSAIVGDSQLSQALSSCTSPLYINSISGTTLPIVFQNTITTLYYGLTISGVTSPVISFPALTSVGGATTSQLQGITVESSSNLTSVTFGSSSGTPISFPSGFGFLVQSNTGNFTLSAYLGSLTGSIQFNNNVNLTSATLAATTALNLQIQNNTGLTSFTLAQGGQLQLQSTGNSLSVTLNPNLRTLTCPNGFVDALGSVEIQTNTGFQDGTTAAILLPLSGVGSVGFGFINNVGAGSGFTANFNYGSTPFGSGAGITITGNTGLNSFQLTGLSSTAGSPLGQIIFNTNTPTTTNPLSALVFFGLFNGASNTAGTPTFSASSVNIAGPAGATGVYVVGVNAININNAANAPYAINGPLAAAFIGASNSSGPFTFSGAIGQIAWGTLSTTATSATVVNGNAQFSVVTAVSSINVNLYSVSGTFSIASSSAGSTGGSVTINAVVLNGGFSFTSNTGFSALTVANLASVAVSTANGFLVNLNTFASGATITTAGNYTVNGNVQFSQNSVASSGTYPTYNIQGLLATSGGIYLQGASSSAQTFVSAFNSSVLCSPNISVTATNGNSNAPVSFPTIAYLGAYGLVTGSNQNIALSVDGTAASSANACFVCTSGTSASCGSPSQFGTACNKPYSSCPYNPAAAYVVNPATTATPTSTTAASTTAASSVSSTGQTHSSSTVSTQANPATTTTSVTSSTVASSSQPVNEASTLFVASAVAVFALALAF